MSKMSWGTNRRWMSPWTTRTRHVPVVHQCKRREIIFMLGNQFSSSQNFSQNAKHKQNCIDGDVNDCDAGVKYQLLSDILFACQRHIIVDGVRFTSNQFVCALHLDTSERATAKYFTDETIRVCGNRERQTKTWNAKQWIYYVSIDDKHKRNIWRNLDVVNYVQQNHRFFFCSFSFFPLFFSCSFRSSFFVLALPSVYARARRAHTHLPCSTT